METKPQTSFGSSSPAEISSTENPLDKGAQECPGRGRLSWLLLVICLLLLPLQVSNQSLWIDEGGTAEYALQPNLRAWIYQLTHDSVPNCQMPLAMFLAWIGAHTIGSAEWQLRVINLVWAMGALIAMFYAGRNLHCPWLPLLLFVQPYFWFYTNEARPYALEIFCGALLLVSVTQFLRDRGQGSRWAWSFAAAGLLLGHTTLLAPFALTAAFAACLVFARINKWHIDRRSWFTVSLAALLLVPIGVYYLYYMWTIRHGVAYPLFWKGGLKPFGYVFYELAGLSGLGPPTVELREAAQNQSLGSMLHKHVPELLLVGFGSFLWSLLLFIGLRRLIQERRWQTFALLSAILLSAGMTMTAMGLVMKKMLWARHWAPVFVFYVAAMGLVIKNCLPDRKAASRHGTLVAATWLLLLLSSALTLRFAAKHQKDDYRTAASLARRYSGQGELVIWAACWECGIYYGLALKHPTTNLDLPFPYLKAAAHSAATNMSSRHTILLSRPSIYDPDGLARGYAAQHRMLREESLCHAFTIFSSEK